MQHPIKFYLSDVPIYQLMYAIHNNNTGMPTSQRRNQKTQSDIYLKRNVTL